MKSINIVFNRFYLSFLLSLFTATVYSQDSKTDTEPGSIAASVESRSFAFQAQSVSPMKGGTRQLTPGYKLTVSGDTLICNLPYFGVVYQANMGSSDGGFDFTSYKFDYQSKIKKKGGWVIKIKTKDTKGQRQFILTVFENGTASLSVNSSDRESISYFGSLLLQ